MNNEKLENLKQHYKLSEAEHNKILKQISNSSFYNKSPDNKPILKYVIAQPGAGKTVLINSILQIYQNFVLVNSDNYRTLRNDTKEIIDNYPTQYTTLTNHDAHKHGDEIICEAMKRNYNILREKAPLNNFVENLPDIPKNYKLEFDVLAVGDLNSALSIYERFETEIVAGIKTAKLSSFERHFESYKEVENTVELLQSNAAINIWIRGKSQDKKPKMVYPNENFKNALEALKYYRTLDNKNTLLNFEKRFNAIFSQMQKRSAPSEQFEQLNNLFKLYQNYKSTLTDNSL